jgi:aminocarboxymuconate-semialdehyde decarboxylase
MGTRLKRIDVHNHVCTAKLIEAVRSNPDRFRMRVEGEGSKLRFARMDSRHVFSLDAELYDAKAKLAGLDRRGLDGAFISPGPMYFFYWLDADAGLEAAAVVNDGIAEMAAQDPERLFGMGTLPMQDPDAAVTELERIVKTHGFRAIEIGTEVGQEQIADPRFRKILRRAQELKVFLFAHPFSFTPLCSGLGKYHLNNLIGNPLASTIMAANLMFSGTLDELPELRICLAHGGGFLPYQIGRFAHGHRVRGDVRADTPSSPYDLLRRFYFDALTHDARALRYLIDLVGADRVCLGTDAPYDMAEDHPLDALGKVKALTPEEREQVSCRTILDLMHTGRTE